MDDVPVGVVIKLFINGHVDDLYALALFFPVGAYGRLHVTTALGGEKDGLFDRVTDVADRRTYVSGENCMPLLESIRLGTAQAFFYAAGVGSNIIDLDGDPVSEAAATMLPVEDRQPASPDAGSPPKAKTIH